MTESQQGRAPHGSRGSSRATPRIHPIAPFGALPVLRGVETLGIDITVGRLTAMRAVPDGIPTNGVVLMVPGFTGSKEDFYALLPLVAALGWDTWAISQRGQADSVAPRGIDAYASRHLAGDVVEVARAIERVTGADRMHLLGHSFGGTVSQAAVIADPSPFKSLTLMCSGPHGWPGRHDIDRRMLLEHPGTNLWRLNNPERADAPDAELGGELFYRQRAEATSTDELLAALDQLADVHDTTYEVAESHLPVMVCHGADDPAWPQDWQRRMARMLKARYAVIPRAAHCPNMENPVDTAVLLDDFWTDVQRKA